MSAPPVTCERCGHRIGQRREHYLLTGGRVWCLRCVERHDAYDQLEGTATRAACLHDRRSAAGVAWCRRCGVDLPAHPERT